MSIRPSLVGKISTRTVFGPKGEILKLVMSDQDQSHDLFTVVGIATETFSGEGDNGPYVGLKGQFMATNSVTGKQFRSGKCFLPSIAVDMVAGVVDSSSGPVEFGFKVMAHYDESAATSYVYDCEPLMDAGENDPLAAIAAKVGVLALEHKAADVEKSTEEKPATKKK